MVSVNLERCKELIKLMTAKIQMKETMHKETTHAYRYTAHHNIFSFLVLRG